MSKTTWLLIIVVGLAVGIYLMQNYESLGLAQLFTPFKQGLIQVFERIQVYAAHPGQIFTDVSSFSYAIVAGLASAITGGIARAAYGKAMEKGEEVSQKAVDLAEQKTEEALQQVTAVTGEKDTLVTKVDLLEQTVQKQEKYYEALLNEQKGKIASMGEQISKLIDEKNQLQRLVAEKTVIVEKAVP